MDGEGDSGQAPDQVSRVAHEVPKLNVTRHVLPQMPSQMPSRLAVSKASLKEYPCLDPFPNLVPEEDVEKPLNPNVDANMNSPSTQPMQTPSSLPAPPSEGTPKDTSPKVAATSPSAVMAGSTSPPTPIKLKIRRSVQQGQLTSSVTLGEDGEPIPNTSPVKASPGIPRTLGTLTSVPTRKTKTKALIKSQSRKKIKTKLREANRQSSSQKSPDEEASETQAADAEDDVAPRLRSGGKPGTQAEVPGARWLVGDLVWAKVTGHPWWPCMVSFDPFTGVYIQTKKNTRPLYHVQFFGQAAERGWIQECSLLDYQGKAALISHCKMVASQSKSKAVKRKFECTVRPTRRKYWDIAYASAEEAFPLSRQERKMQFTFDYQIPSEKLPPGSVPASKSNSQKEGSEGRPKKKNTKRKLKDVETDDSQTESCAPPKKKRKTKTSTTLVDQSEAQFAVFCQKRRASVKEEHQDLSEEQISKMLEEQWKELTSEDQQKFIPMGSDVSKLGVVMGSAGTKVRSGRISQPTRKKLESGEIQKLLATSPGKSRSRFSEALNASYDEVISSVAMGYGDVFVPDDISDAEKSSRKASRSKKKFKGDEATESETEERLQVKRPRKLSQEEPSTDGEGSEKSNEKAAVRKSGVRTRITLEEREEDLEILKLSTAGPSKKENICQICEEPGKLITCEGACFGSFHLSCIGLSVEPTGPFKCDECVAGMHTCFSCKEKGSDTKRCVRPNCGKFYHENCVRKYPHTRFENSHFVCPLHTCATCAFDSPGNPKASRGRLFKCVKCPTAYHVGDFCIAAGSRNIVGFNIVCSDHFVPLKNKKYYLHLNVSWCFLCSLGGTLLCCERCPAAFHADCLKTDFPEGTWHCKDCTMGRRPLYGDIVWVKVGQYRWWPGEVCHPRHVPRNIQDMPYTTGEFPIRFFGSNDYYWITHGRVFLFQDGDKGTKETTSSKGIDKTFHKAVLESVAAFKIWQKAKEDREQLETVKNDKKPPPYKHIKMNVPYGNVTINRANLSELPRCECRPSLDAPCSPESDCLNRMLLCECNPAVCLAGEKCFNQRFQQRDYVPTRIVRTESRGWALETLIDIKKGRFVIEYCGELIDEEECKRRIKQAHDQNVTNFYMLTLDSSRTIDAGPKGNLSRFMNHSCQPNCDTQKWNVNGDVRVGLFANVDIPAGSELTFNYNLDCLGNEKTVCRCSAPNCSGFLGVPPKKEAELTTEKPVKDKKKKKKKKKANVVVEHEDDCYRCGEGGELVMCDRSKCPKAYHLQCLNLEKPPHGKWDCPWHHCDICGKGATKLCSECPNSFCNKHIEDNIFDIGEGKLVCGDHEDLLAVLADSRSAAVPKVDPNDEKSSTSSDSSEDSETSPSISDSESSAAGQVKDSDSEAAKTPSIVNYMEDSKPVEDSRTAEDSETVEDSTDKPETTELESQPPEVKVSAKKKRRSSLKSKKDIQLATVSDSDSVISAEPAQVEKPLSSAESTAATPSSDKRSRGRPRSKQKKTPDQSGKKPSKKNTSASKRGHTGKSQMEGEQVKKDELPFFDDKDDDFPDLVIDIPTY